MNRLLQNTLYLLNNYDPKLRNKNIVDDQSSILFHYFLYPNVYHMPSFSPCTILMKILLFLSLHHKCLNIIHMNAQMNVDECNEERLYLKYFTITFF